jgi:hypothetical protein
MSRLGTQSEIDKLAETLSLAPAELEFLSELPPQELRSLRISIYERLFGQDAVLFERLAMFAVRMPPRAGRRRSSTPLTASGCGATCSGWSR